MKLEHLIKILPDRDDDAKKRQDVVRPRRFSRYLARRTATRRVYLNVWDLARTADGATRSDLNSRITASGPASNIFEQDNGFNDALFAVDYLTWADVFYNITTVTDDYRATFGEFGEYVVGKGLKGDSAAPELLVSAEDCYFNTWPSPIEDNIRFTATTDPGDPDATFTFDRDCDLFLAPAMFNRGGTAYQISTTPDQFNRLMPLKAPLTRSTIGSSDFDTVWTNRTTPGAGGIVSIPYYRGLFLADGSPDLILWDTAFPSGPGTPEDAVDFPTSSDFLSWNLDPRIAFYPSSRFTDHCLGAIRKHLSGGSYEWYFIWAKQLLLFIPAAWAYGSTVHTWGSPTPDANRGILV